ncbi:MAG TPA: polysaccharide deacetylase family protein [Ktedonobacterales bacterium]
MTAHSHITVTQGRGSMNLVSYSMKTKGARNFTRRLWTVFTRFGISEARTRTSLLAAIRALQAYGATPTFFIPAVVLRRHRKLLAEIARDGAEIGIHGHVHNDYRSLSAHEQRQQTQQAISVFQQAKIPYQGFRNPYLGWTEESVNVFADLGFTYDSNEAVLHDVVDLDRFSPVLRDGYAKSLTLFQALPCNHYTVRPHYEGALVRIPTSIPDDEMLFDRLRITDAEEVGQVWCNVMQRVYALGGIYTLNLHPERAVLCLKALDALLIYANSRQLPIWLACLRDVACWWRERRQFSLTISPRGQGCWRVEAACTPRATLLARHLVVENQPTTPWFGPDVRLNTGAHVVHAERCPCIALSARTPKAVADLLREQGYPAVHCSEQEAPMYALYVDMPEGLGATRAEQVQRRSTLLDQIDGLEAPLVYFGCWPDGRRAALAISGDIDSVTVQDFFFRVLEVSQFA